MARKPEMLNILLTRDETKRIMHLFPERRGGQGILLSFSASLFRCVIGQSCPANVKFQRYADNFEE